MQTREWIQLGARRDRSGKRIAPLVSAVLAATFFEEQVRSARDDWPGIQFAIAGLWIALDRFSSCRY